MWYTYIIRTHNNRLYTGITTDIHRRWREHASGRAGARFFRTGRPMQLCRLESFTDRSAASRREAAIKKLSRAEKDTLVGSASPGALPDLTPDSP